MSNNPGTEGRPLRVAVVGSGPSGFYAAESMFKADAVIEVDVYDSLCAPFGLVRYGVAPDHAKLKKVIKVYEKTASNDRFAFFGNVTVGRDIRVEELRRFYDAIVFANGAQTDRRLGIPGEDLPGSYTATEFVAWYNGHPDFQDRTFDLSHEVAVIIGQGNVAMDVGRILAKSMDELKNTDITAQSLERLAESRVREIHMIGRRGPAQAAFTPPEIKEFGELAICEPVVTPESLVLNAQSATELENNREAKKNYGFLKGFSERPAPTSERRFIIHFLKSPKELVGNGRLERVILEKNTLAGNSGKQWSEGTGETEVLECGALFRSVGYRGVPIEGVPFEEKRGVFPNEDGRIVNGSTPIPGLYAVGWIKRGPTGVIGTNKPDANATIKNLLEDIPSLKPCEEPTRAAVSDFFRIKGVAVISYADWQKIDAAEVECGQVAGKPREKFVHVDEMLRAAEKD
ncbi:MAG: NADP oxidoreductase [bacterium]|nr:NADP oxidoreductase [bacterium]